LTWLNSEKGAENLKYTEFSESNKSNKFWSLLDLFSFGKGKLMGQMFSGLGSHAWTERNISVHFKSKTGVAFRISSDCFKPLVFQSKYFLQ